MPAPAGRSAGVTVWLLAAAKMSPGSDVGLLTAVPRAERFTWPKPTVDPPRDAAPCSSIPSERSLSVVASRMMASTKTCRRRTSRSPITPRNVSQSADVALTTSVLVAGSAVMRTGASSGMAAPVPVLTGCGCGGGAGAGGGSPIPPS